MSEITKMLSFDTSSRITGYAYWENGKLKKSGVINFEKEKDTLIRVENMCFGITDILKEYSPDIVVIERPPLVNSPGTLIMLAEIVGVVKGWSICAGYAEYVEFATQEWKKLVAYENEKVPVKRDDSKAWSMMKTKEYFGVDAADDNESDAILIGLARICQFKDLKEYLQSLRSFKQKKG